MFNRQNVIGSLFGFTVMTISFLTATGAASADVKIDMPPPPPPPVVAEQTATTTDDAAASTQDATTALAASPDLLGEVAITRFSRYRHGMRNAHFSSGQRGRRYIDNTVYRSYWGPGYGYPYVGWGFAPYVWNTTVRISSGGVSSCTPTPPCTDE